MKRDLSNTELSALLNMPRTADGITLIKLFEAERRDAQLKLETAQDVAAISRLQGKALFLKEFLERVEQTPKLLEQARARYPRPTRRPYLVRAAPPSWERKDRKPEQEH